MTEIVYCDKCKKEFEYRSINIDETSVDVGDKALLLNYFACPFCGVIYKVLIVDKEKYWELLNDYNSIIDRISQQRGKCNPMHLQRLTENALQKKKRLKRYVDSMNRKYNGEFVMLSEGEGNKRIIYIP